MNFSSDTSAPHHPAVLAAITEANRGPAPSYGTDPWTLAAQRQLSDAFETDVDVWLVASGTAANALGLSVLCPPIASVLCHAEAHIERDERGAVEFFSGGAKLSLLPGPHGKIEVAALARRLAANRPGFVHETPAAVLSLSNLTECGAAYAPAEIAERAELAHAAGLKVHLDGARFSNALVSTGAAPADLSWRAGVDVMSFGGTKNGALGCEAIVLFGEARRYGDDLRARAKRSGHMPPKMRFLAAQMNAYLKDGLWLDLARSANAAAQRLAETLVQQGGGVLAHPVDGNEVFVRLAPNVVDRLTRHGVSFYPWSDGSYRFVCSWATTPADLTATAACLASTG